MLRWAVLLGGLLVLVAHFFLLYAFASIFPGTTLAAWLTIGATVVALALDAMVLRAAVTTTRAAGERTFDRWIGEAGLVGALLSMIAILWQMLPALF